MTFSLPPRTLPKVGARRQIQASKIFRIESMDLTFANGTQANYERIIGGRGAVMAVPFDGTYFYLTSEYGGGVMDYVLGLAKGKIDQGETPEQAVVRELSEELGLYARQVTLLKHQMLVAPGMLELCMYPFLCEELEESARGGDEPEPIECFKLTVREVKDLIFDPNSCLVEGRCIAALILALHKIGALK